MQPRPAEARAAAAAPDGDEVLQGLAHLEALDVQVAQVQEVVHPRHVAAATRRAAGAAGAVAAAGVPVIERLRLSRATKTLISTTSAGPHQQVGQSEKP